MGRAGRWFVVLGMLVAGLMLAAPPAQAVPTTVTFDLTSCHLSGGCGTATQFGTVTLTQVGGNVLFDVVLNSGNLFVETGAGAGALFVFNDTDATDTITTISATLGGVDVTASIAFHRRHNKLATITAVQPPGRYGALQLEGSQVRGFTEKPRGDGGLINGGFFVLSPRCLDRISGDETSWEVEPLTGLAADGELMAFPHSGFWQPMDTLRDRTMLENLWESGRAPWKVW